MKYDNFSKIQLNVIQIHRQWHEYIYFTCTTMDQYQTIEIHIQQHTLQCNTTYPNRIYNNTQFLDNNYFQNYFDEYLHKPKVLQIPYNISHTNLYYTTYLSCQ